LKTYAPLKGIVVIALEQAVAAPFCTGKLADSGARVIKIERPDGDFARFYDDATPGGSSYFVWLNRGKESVVLDLRGEAARQALYALVAHADVLVQNLKPGALARLGYSTEKLQQENPSLICCSISGYGEIGPFVNRKAYDMLIQAESGLASITGGPDEPARVGISIADIATGATAHAAILDALLLREKTGRGVDIRISMFDVMADWMTVPLLCAEAGAPPQRVGLSHPSIAPYGAFCSMDGLRVLISVQNDREWRAFCGEVLLRADLADDPRFATNMLRVRHRTEVDAAIVSEFATLPSAVLIDRLTKADIAFAGMNDLAGLSRHPHLRRVNAQTNGGVVSLPAPAPTINGYIRSSGSVPSKGEHTERVLAELGLGAATAR
jgi:itaconate CoA-transferase